MTVSPITARTYSASKKSALLERIARIDTKDVKRNAQLATLLVDLCYSVAAWRESGTYAKTRATLDELRGTTGVAAEIKAALPNVSDKAQRAMIELARVIETTGDSTLLDHPQTIKMIIKDSVHLMAGKPHRDLTVDGLAELASESETLKEFASELGMRRHLSDVAIEAEKLIKDEEVDQAPDQDQLPATPQELINNAAAILNADALRNCEDVLELDVIAQLLTKIIRQNKIVTARKSAELAA